MSGELLGKSLRNIGVAAGILGTGVAAVDVTGCGALATSSSSEPQKPPIGIHRLSGREPVYEIYGNCSPGENDTKRIGTFPYKNISLRNGFAVGAEKSYYQVNPHTREFRLIGDPSSIPRMNAGIPNGNTVY